MAEDLDRIRFLATIAQHRIHVRRNLQKVVHALEERSLLHDESKFSVDEFEGFARINEVARTAAYGSEEYRQSMKAEKPTLELHFSRNRHHPEFFPPDKIGQMEFLDLIEMVCDWRAAWTVYEAQKAPEHRTTWEQAITVNRERFFVGGPLTALQWHLVAQVAAFLDRECVGGESPHR